MSDINIPPIGGPHHLEDMWHTNAPIIQLPDGEVYHLQFISYMGNRPFYLHSSLKGNAHEAILSYLLSTNYCDSHICRVHASWFKKMAQHRLRRDNYIYLDARRFFADISPEERPTIVRHEFDKRLKHFMFTSRLVSFDQVILAFKHNFKNAFFTPFAYTKSAEQRREAYSAFPLAKTTGSEIYRLLQPKSIAEAELLALSLAYYCSSTSYLFAIVKGRKRIDLSGVPREPVSLHERRHAAKVLLNRDFIIPDHLMRTLGLT